MNATPEATTAEHSVRELRDMIETADLGPTSSVDVKDIHDTEVIIVVLDTVSPRKARTLQRWLTLITAWDMIDGKYDDTDRMARLNVRGQFPGGTPIIVVAPFSEDTEPEQAALIHAHIERQRPHELVRRLAEIETRQEDHRG